MEKAPLAEPNNGQVIFAALRDILAELYAEESTARTVVHDAGLDAKQIPFSARAQTNWHNILAEAIRQARLDPLLKIALADYAANPALLAAYGQYRLWIEQDGYLEAPASLSADASVTIAGNVNLNQGDFVGRDKLIAGDDVGGDKVEGDKIDAHSSPGFLNRPTAPVAQHFGTAIHLGPLKISKPVVGILFTSLVAVVLFIGAIALSTRNMSEAITAPTPTPTSTIPTATPTRTPLPTATPLAFATQAVSETLIVIATFHNTAATDSEAHTKIRRAIAEAAASNNEQQLRVEVEPTELNADQRTEAEALGNRYNASMVIWGEDTGVEVIVNFLNLKEPDGAASAATITERECTQLANPSAYARFITQDLPQTMNFFAFFAVGRSYYLNTQYTLAIERIEAAVVFVPLAIKPVGLADAYFLLGWLYTNQGKLDKAIASYTRSSELNNSNLPCLYNNQGIAYYKQGKLDKAIANYNQAIHLDPDFALAYHNRGIVYYDQRMLDEAIADYNQAIHLDPDNAVNYNNRGNSYAAQGKLEEAIDDYGQAIHLNPNDAVTYNHRGIALYAQGKLEEAIADYNQVIQLKPDYAEAYTNRGVAFAVQDKLDEAIADHNQAIHLNPDFAGAYYNRGITLSDQGKLEEAIADFDQVIHLDPKLAQVKLAQVYYSRGATFADQGKLEEAITDYNQAIQLNPNYAKAYNNRGRALAAQDKLDEAIIDYNQAIHLNPNYALAYNNRGQVYSKQGKLEEAIADFDQTINLDRDYAEAYSNRGLAYVVQGKLKEAIADFDQAIHLKTDYANAFGARGLAYRILGKPKEALADFRRYLELQPNAENRAQVEAWIAEAALAKQK